MRRPLLFILLCVTEAQAQQADVYSVCELFTRSPINTDHRVQVRGLLDGSPFHGYVLKTTTDGPCSAIRQELRGSPSAILLAWRSSHGVRLAEADERANRDLLGELAERFARRDVAPLPVLVKGTIIWKRSVAISPMPNGGYRGNGFGEMGAFPAIMVVLSVERQ